MDRSGNGASVEVMGALPDGQSEMLWKILLSGRDETHRLKIVEDDGSLCDPMDELVLSRSERRRGNQLGAIRHMSRAIRMSPFNSATTLAEYLTFRL